MSPGESRVGEARRDPAAQDQTRLRQGGLASRGVTSHLQGASATSQVGTASVVSPWELRVGGQEEGARGR